MLGRLSNRACPQLTNVASVSPPVVTHFLWPVFRGECSIQKRCDLQVAAVKVGHRPWSFSRNDFVSWQKKKKILKFSFLKWTTTSPVVFFFNSWKHQSLLSSAVITITQQVFVSHICEAFLANQNTPLKPLCLLWQRQQPKLPKYIFFLNQI